MKKLLAVVALALAACATKEPYVKLSHEIVPKAVSISVVTMDIQASTSGVKVRRAQILGSGVFISPYGHVLTCAHLFPFREKLATVCDSDGVCMAGEVLYIDQRKDLALVKVNDTTPNYAKLTREIKVGQEVLAVGSPYGFNFTVTRGIISALDRDTGLTEHLTQSDAAINPGNSGGPLFNMQGELVGINSQLVSPLHTFCGLGFSVQPDQIQEFLRLFRGLSA
jgi:serine protease Do